MIIHVLVSELLENIVGKGGNGAYKIFSFFRSIFNAFFQKASDTYPSFSDHRDGFAKSADQDQTAPTWSLIFLSTFGCPIIIFVKKIYVLNAISETEICL